MKWTIMLKKDFNVKDLGTTKKKFGMKIHKDKSARKLWFFLEKLC